MTTWRCSLVAGALALAGCTEGTGFSLGSGGDTPPLQQVDMARGAINLVAPAGYCIDPGTVRPRFAALARCDTLGGETTAFDIPLGLVTVSIAEGAATAPLAMASGADLLEERNGDNLALVRLRGGPVAEGFSDVHWRGAGQIGGFAVGLAAYGPEGGRITGEAGARLLGGIMAGLQTKALSEPPTAPADVTPPPRPAQNRLLTRLAGLFD
ncbi:MAG: dihydroxy-acid dehydratase [Pseudomonadota bacterium]